MSNYKQMDQVNDTSPVIDDDEEEDEELEDEDDELEEEEIEEEEPKEKPKEKPKKIKTEKKENLILIGTPCYRTIHIRTVQAIMDTLRVHPEAVHAFQNGVFVHENDNNLVELAKQKKATHLFLVEHDMVFEPDTLGKLLEQDKDVIAASYNHRTLPLHPMIYQQAPDTKELYLMNYETLWPKETFKCFGVPTGCTLIKMSVFDKIKKPYFSFKYKKNGKIKMSQDMYFCKKVNEAGLEVWADPNIMISHIGDYDY